MSKVYGYGRISTQKQSIERQERNIKAAYPEAVIVKEVYTGTKTEGREQFEKLLKKVKPGDTIVFDSVSRMSRNSAEGFQLYRDLFEKGVSLVFLKEPHINTDTYKQAIEAQMQGVNTGDDVADEFMENIMAAINRYMMRLAERQIVLAFDQAEKEVMDLHQRTKEGIETARLNGKQIGLAKGSTLKIKKKEPAKQTIREHCKSFGGSLSDVEVMKLTGLARNTYYKYKKEVAEERGGS